MGVPARSAECRVPRVPRAAVGGFLGFCAWLCEVFCGVCGSAVWTVCCLWYLGGLLAKAKDS